MFYMAFMPYYILILAFTIVIDYIAGRCIENAHGGGMRRLFLIISICANVGILAFFKYFNFINRNILHIAQFLDLRYPVPMLTIILPIGLSFYTFQAMSYTIEVYRGAQKVERNFFIYALYVMFYPQLVAGPIERSQNLIHQFYEKHYFDYKRVTDGLKLMVWGMFKKVVIADRLATMVNLVYRDPTNYTGLPLIVATIFFAFQIYCDFSGYSDIAIGAAQTMGFRLMDNFNRPYFSKSIAEFWKRWHISLASWFKDYLYIPLGGNKVSKARWCCNIFVTFLISGLWHGARWNFLIWGALNGFFVLLSILTKGLRQNFIKAIGLARVPVIHRSLQLVITFSLVSFGWIFFRANNLKDAVYIVTHLFTGMIDSFRHISLSITQIGSGKRWWSGFTLGDRYGFMLAVFLIVFMEFMHMIQRHGSIRHMLSDKPIWLRWAIYYSLIFGILLFGVFNRSPFIYFQF